MSRSPNSNAFEVRWAACVLPALTPLIALLLAAPLRAAPSQTTPNDSLATPTAQQQEPAADHWKFEVDLGLSGALGNNEFLIATTRYKVDFVPAEDYLLRLSAELRYGESKGSVIARRIKTGLDLELESQSHWSPFINMQAERDPFRRLDVRSKTGAGLNYTISEERTNRTTISVLVQHDYQAFTEPRGRAAITDETSARWSLRATSDRRSEAGLRIQHQTMIDAVHDTPSDYDLDSTTKLTVPLSARIGLKLTYEFNRDSTPAEGVQKNDHLLDVGLTIGF